MRIRCEKLRNICSHVGQPTNLTCIFKVIKERITHCSELFLFRLFFHFLFFCVCVFFILGFSYWHCEGIAEEGNIDSLSVSLSLCLSFFWHRETWLVSSQQLKMIDVWGHRLVKSEGTLKTTFAFEIKKKKKNVNRWMEGGKKCENE